MTRKKLANGTKKAWMEIVRIILKGSPAALAPSYRFGSWTKKGTKIEKSPKVIVLCMTVFCINSMSWSVFVSRQCFSVDFFIMRPKRILLNKKMKRPVEIVRRIGSSSLSSIIYWPIFPNKNITPQLKPRISIVIPVNTIFLTILSLSERPKFSQMTSVGSGAI